MLCRHRADLSALDREEVEPSCRAPAANPAISDHCRHHPVLASMSPTLSRPSLIRAEPSTSYPDWISPPHPRPPLFCCFPASRCLVRSRQHCRHIGSPSQCQRYPIPQFSRLAAAEKLLENHRESPESRIHRNSSDLLPCLSGRTRSNFGGCRVPNSSFETCDATLAVINC